MEKAKYYLKGEIKVYQGKVYIREKGKYVLDFYHDEDYLIKPKNECSEEEALKEFQRLYKTTEGFN